MTFHNQAFKIVLIKWILFMIILVKNWYKKTENIICNKRGLSLANKLNGQKVRIVDEYQYLGLRLKPSGSTGVAVQELHDKASRAWFGISNTVAKNKEWKLRKYLTFLTHL